MDEDYRFRPTISTVKELDNEDDSTLWDQPLFNHHLLSQLCSNMVESQYIDQLMVKEQYIKGNNERFGRI